MQERQNHHPACENPMARTAHRFFTAIQAESRQGNHPDCTNERRGVRKFGGCLEGEGELLSYKMAGHRFDLS